MIKPLRNVEYTDVVNHLLCIFSVKIMELWFGVETENQERYFTYKKKVIRLIIGVKNLNLVSVYLENFKYSH